MFAFYNYEKLYYKWWVCQVVNPTNKNKAPVLLYTYQQKSIISFSQEPLKF